MSLPQACTRFTFEDYLVWEPTQELRHEYLNGEVFAMTGARRNHVTVTVNLTSALRNLVRGTPCRVYAIDMKLRIASADAACYPDVSVSCDERDRRTDLFIAHPLLIIEVLSPSTAAWDRSRKFDLYRQIDTLQEYVLIEPELRSVDVFRRRPAGDWLFQPFRDDEAVELAALGCTLPMALIYEDVDFPPDAAADPD